MTPGRPEAATDERPRRIVLAPNAFKGTFDAVEVARLWSERLSRRPDVTPIECPLSDGGDGFLAVLRHARRSGAGSEIGDLLEARLRVRDPLGRPRAARWAWDPQGDRAYVESAEAVGLARLAEEERDPELATSRGLGQMLAAAAGLGARTIVVGLGGSATVDGGLGTGRAWGYRYEASDGGAITRPRDLVDLARVIPPDTGPLDGVEVVALADVRNPLTGPDGAARVYGPQKGAGPDAVERLEVGLVETAERWIADLGAPVDLARRPGAGAAGGLGAALVALAGARLEWGPDWIAARTGVETAIREADGVITGEGRFDPQSADDKATGWAIEAAGGAGVPVAVVAGEIASDADLASTRAALDGRDLGLDAGARLDARAVADLVERAVDRLFPGRAGAEP